MKYRAISFDAAGTLIDVNWHPQKIAVAAANQVGISISDTQVAEEIYQRMLYGRWSTFQDLNKERSIEKCDAFWKELGHDWLIKIGGDTTQINCMFEVADDLIFGKESTVFKLFNDSIPILNELKSRGLPVIILSNWDVSLHRTCKLLGLTPLVAHVVASLEEGFEKPDPRLFQVARNLLETDSVLHIGDDPLADIHGAREFGWDALLLDRNSPPDHQKIQSLSEVLNYL